MKPYYYVHNPLRSTPRVKHDSLELAQAESERLASNQPGDSFEILKCVGITSIPITKPNTFWMDGYTPYRDLNDGEEICFGDEFLNDGKWIKYDNTSYISNPYQKVGLQHDFPHLPHRRSI